VFPGIAAGSIFTFSLSLGDYIAVTIVGGKTQMLGNIIYGQLITANNQPLAAALSIIPLVAIIAYLLSVSGYKFRIAALSEGRWDDAHKLPYASKLVEPANYLVTIAMILGFVCFGYFSIGNLQVIEHDKEKPFATSPTPSPAPNSTASPTPSPGAASGPPPTRAPGAAKAGGNSVQEGEHNAGGAVRSAEDAKPESR